MPPTQRDIDEQNHVLGKKCRACNTIVTDDYPGILYAVDYTNSPENPPQLVDLMVYHSPLLPPVFPPKAEVDFDRACENMVGVAVSGLITKNSHYKKLGFAQIDSADLQKTVKFIENHFGLYTTWGADAQATLRYLLSDLKQNTHTPKASDYQKAFHNRFVLQPSDPPTAISAAPNAMLKHLLDFQDCIKAHNSTYANSKDEEPQPTVFAPTVLPSAKSGHCILVHSYMHYKPTTITRAKALFGYYRYEFPKAIAEFILGYGELYIDAARAIRDASVNWSQPWKDQDILKFLNTSLTTIKPSAAELRALPRYLEQTAAKLQLLPPTDIKRNIGKQLMTSQSAILSALL